VRAGDVPHELRDYNWDYIQPKKLLKRDEEQEADIKMEEKTLTSSSVSMSCSTRPSTTSNYKRTRKAKGVC
jgi:hypothetical protein